MAGDHWLGVDLGGTKILAGVFDDDFKVLARHKAPTEAAGGLEVVCNQLKKVVESALHQAGLRPDQICGLGMGIPGQIDPVANRVRYAPNLGWKNVDLAKELEDDWKWPCFFENDVKLGTYGEFTHGAAKGARHVLGVFVGTGVGGGLILNGDLYSGFNFNAGEIGHTVVHWRKGTNLEAIAGRLAITRRAADLLADATKKQRKAWKNIDPTAVKSSHLAELYQANDPIAVQLIDDGARALGAALGSALNLLSPEVIVIGGGLAGALGDSYLERIWELALRHALPHVADGVRCVPAALKDDSGIFGAAAFARANAQTAARQ